MLSEIPNAANYSDHALRQLFAPHAHSTFLRIRDIVQRARARYDDGEQASDCENDLVRGNRCDSSTAISVARAYYAHKPTEPAQSPSFSSRRIATRLLIQMEVVLVAAACCRARKPPLKDGRTDRPTASVVPCRPRLRRRCFFQLSISIQCSSISLTPFPPPPRPRPRLPRPLSPFKVRTQCFLPPESSTDRPRE